jgi:membrane fusion protein, heavy metal efflux system
MMNLLYMRPQISSSILLIAIIMLLAQGFVGCGGKETESTTTTTTDSTAHQHSASEAGHTDEHTGHSESEEGHAHEEGGHEEHDEGGAVKLTDDIIKQAGINFLTVKKQTVIASVSAPGKVIPAQNAVGHIGSLINGRVARIFKPEGSSVGKGTVVAELEAFDIGELKAEYSSASAAVDQTKTTLDRQERLSREGIGAKRALDEARSAHSQAVARLRAAEAKLTSLGISTTDLQRGAYTTRISIRSPLAGVITKQNVVVGEYVDPTKDMFEVVNMSTVWVEAQVPSTLARELRNGVRASLRGPSGERGTGVVSYISPTVDPESRTVPVRVVVNNLGSQLRPQAFVTVDFERATEQVAIVIPRSAIEQEGDKSYVYKEKEPSTFERTEVVLGSSTGLTAVVLSGVAEGDKIVNQGVFYLKSLRQKGELQEHSH